ncbi:MAG: Crp/Fnr family transcriptional regulator [Coriobacteriia bacterium]|nr:Crp/Fnr family transcriptional regulator [Coriobacteriia bacterium]
MRQIFEIVKDNLLFTDISFSDFEQMLDCMTAKVAKYGKDEIILLSGDTIDFVGLVLSGSVRIIKEDFEGRTTIYDEVGVSEAFGEVFACVEAAHSPVTIVSAEASEILFIDYRKIISYCSNACPFHSQLIANMLKLVARKAQMLNQKIEILSQRTIRDKLMCYFNFERGAATKFKVPYNRGEMADYVCVDRSAMSKELSKMRDEGLIEYFKNEFEILQ